MYTNDLILTNKPLIESLFEQICNILSDAFRNNAVEYIKSYDSETDAMALSTGLAAINDMINHAKSLFFNPLDENYVLVKAELVRYIKEVSSVIIKFRRKRPIPHLSERDMQIYFEIEDGLEKVFGYDSGISFKYIIPLLLEASDDSSSER